MFDNVSVQLLDKNMQQLGTTIGDLQPYDKIISFEDDLEIEISYRLFCSKNNFIAKEGYLLIDEITYKVMHIKRWSDYLEILLYECGG